MNFIRVDIIVAALAMVFCLEIAVVFGIIYWQGRLHREHLVFSLFNLALAAVILLRLLMLAEIGNRFVALRLLQGHCLAGIAAVAAMMHFTYLITGRRLHPALSLRAHYLFGFIIGALLLLPVSLRVVPPGMSAYSNVDKETGPLFYVCLLLLVGWGLMPCYLLYSSVRSLSADSPSLRFQDGTAVSDTPDLVLLRRHLALIFRGMLVLMAFVLVDAVWFLFLPSDPPLPFSALGMIFLSAVTAFVLARDIARGERQKIHLATVAQARLTSLSDAQHQLKNQIASISRPLMTAMRGVERGAPIGFVKDKLATAIRESEELQQTLDIMLNAARLEADRPLDIGWKASVDLAALLEMLCSKRASLASTSGGERYRIEVTIPSVRVFVHEAALKQVLNNIIDNAFKYSPDESLIEVQATVQEPVQMLYIRIRDGGVGISPEDQERIFNEPFYRGSADSRETPGTGLGLNLARRYVEAMHGTVQVESRGAGTGSTFVIALPYEPDKTPPSLAMERK